MKTKNLKIYGIISLLFLGIYAVAQMVVEDPANLVVQRENQIKLVEQVKIAQEQAARLSKMRDDITKNLEYVEKVNTQVKNISKLKKIAKKQALIFNRAYEIKNEFRKSKHLEVSLMAEETTNEILMDTEEDIQDLSKILRTGIFNMTDAERLEQIDKYDRVTSTILNNLSELKDIFKKYDYAISIYTNLDNPQNK